MSYSLFELSILGGWASVLRTLLISSGFYYLRYSFIFQIPSYQDGESEPGRTEMTLCVICPEVSLLFEILGNQKYIFLSAR